MLTVAILGGGVAGLSAAHELAERGFQVHVYELKPVLGGKARSIPVPDSAREGRKPLPGEHGFRFFPGFYKHVTDTMRRIPYGRQGSTFDNLTVATRWSQYLGKLGVEFHSGMRVTGIETDGARVTGATVQSDSGSSSISADFFIAALPVEKIAPLMNDNLKRAAPSLANLDQLKTRWMNGIQFYLSQDVSLVNGHAIYLNSPWALTSISQAQFWTHVDFPQFGDGTVRGILSVDISEWEAPGILYGKPARECTAEQIKDEVWAQLKQHLNVGGAAPISDANLVSWFLDPDIEYPNPGSATNAEPLLINTAGSLQYRPEAQVELENFFVASDYVRTYTDLACMEAANEAARRAVNCLLAASGSSAAPAQLWPLEEPAFLKPVQEIDRIRYTLGLPHHLAAQG